MVAVRQSCCCFCDSHVRACHELAVAVDADSRMSQSRVPYVHYTHPATPLSAQKARAVNSATPLLIQWLGSLSVASSIIIMKLVLCPVVDSVPARVSVLYTGQS